MSNDLIDRRTQTQQVGLEFCKAVLGWEDVRIPYDTWTVAQSKKGILRLHGVEDVVRKIKEWVTTLGYDEKDYAKGELGYTFDVWMGDAREGAMESDALSVWLMQCCIDAAAKFKEKAA